MNSPVESSCVEGLSIVTINRPEAHNALNTDVLTQLRVEVLAAAAAPEVRAVIVVGAGDKAFCAGADLKEFSNLGRDDAMRRLSYGQEVMRDIESAPIPVIAAVNGLALGGGFELALACTFPVLSTTASFGLPEAGLGLIPGYGGTQRLPRAIGPAAAAYVMLTGDRLDAERAYGLGLSPLPPVPPSDLLRVAVDVAQRVSAKGPRAVQSILSALDIGRDATATGGLKLETVLAAAAATGAESTEGITAFVERRSPDFSTGP